MADKLYELKPRESLEHEHDRLRYDHALNELAALGVLVERPNRDLWSRTERQAEAAENRRGWAEAFRNGE